MAEVHLQDDDYKGQFNAHLWRRMLQHARPYRRPLAILGSAAVLLAIIESLFPLLTARLIDEASQQARRSELLFYGGLYAAFFLLFAVCVWIFIRQAGKTATGVAYDLRSAGFRRLQELSFSYYDRRSTGWLVTRLTSDVTKIASLLPWFTLDLVWGSLMIVGIAIVMLWLHWQLGLLVLIIVPALALISLYFQVHLLDSARKIRRTNSQLTANFNESVMGVRTTKTLVREADNLKEFQELSTSMFTHSMRNALQSAVYLPLTSIIGTAGVGLALWFGGVQILRVTNTLSLGELIAFMQYATLLYMPIQEIARRFTDLQSAQAAAERIQDLLDTEPAIQDSPAVRQQIAEASTQALAPHLAPDGKPRHIESIRFQDVTFAYKTNETVLDRFHLTVRAGETVALVGSTGSGKSTIVNLLARFYEPTSGHICINDDDYRQRGLQWYQSQLGVMLQTPHLFRGSVCENIRYGRLDASDADVIAAAQQVNAHDFIQRLPDGYDTNVGESGGNLSTGQRQLIALARAFLANPQIVIMDEATSSIDTETERIIQDAIETVLAGRIAFVIAHRLSTIRSVDQILVIDQGRILEQGTHSQLMRKKGRYHELYTRQFVQTASDHLTPSSTFA